MKLLTCVGRNYQVNHKIGSGSFGEIYVGKDLQTGEEVAIKAESIHRKNPHLVFECNVYRSMNLSVGIPKIYWFGVDGDFAVLVMQLLGPSLEDLFFQSGRRFSLKTTLLLADQMIERLERVHSKYFIHRDIKPHNFLMGRPGTDTEQTLYLIDFGLAKNFRNVKTRCHIPYRDGKSLTGTARYVSIKTHLGVEQSRRDDLESLGYVFIYFLKGILPWQGLKATSKKDKYEKITERKLTTSIETLCKHQPQEFVLYIQYCRNLGFTDPPNYKYLRKLLKDVARKLNYQYDNIYDWTKVPKNICPALKSVQNKLIYQRTNDSQVAKGDQKEDTNHQHQQFQQPSVHQLQISNADQNINQVITSINATSNCINYNYRLPQLGELAATPAVAAVSPKTTDVESIKCE